MWRLVWGVILTERRSLLTTLPMGMVLFRPGPFPDWLAGGLGAVLALGVGAGAVAGLEKRELVVMPVDKADVRRATWVLATMLPMVWLAVGRCLGGLFELWLGDDGRWVFYATPTQMLLELLLLLLLGGWAVRNFKRPVSNPFFVARTESTTSALPARAVSLEQTRIVGVWTLLRGVVGQALGWTVLMLVFVMAMQLNRPRPDFWAPFDSSTTDLRFLGLWMPMLFLLGVFPSLGRWIGALKRLPMSAGQTALLLGVAPAATPMFFWTVLMVMHLAVSQTWPDTLRLGLLVIFIGAGALADAIGIKSGSTMMRYFSSWPLLVVFMFGMEGDRDAFAATVSHWAVPLLGVVCLGLSWLVNLHTLTRSSRSARAYRYGRTPGLPQEAR